MKSRSKHIAHLETSDVPQADDILKVFQVIGYLSTGATEVSRYMGLAPRQVFYYRHAARLLGYVDRDGFVTATGARLARLRESHQLAHACQQFEASTCGSAWMNWSGVTTLGDVERDSAERFLTEVSELSPATARRRAKTLSSWHRHLLLHEAPLRRLTRRQFTVREQPCAGFKQGR